MPKGKKKAAKVTNGATGNSSVEASTGQVRPNAPYLENRGALILSIGPEAATGLNFSAEELPEGLTQIPGLHITLIGVRNASSDGGGARFPLYEAPEVYCSIVFCPR